MYTRDVKPQNERRLFVTEHDVQQFAEIFSAPLSPANQHLDPQTRIEPRVKEGMSASRFGGLKTTDAVIRLVAKGWAEGASKLRALASELQTDLPAAKSSRRRMRWGDDGDTLDEDRALAGEWDTAYRTARREIATGTSVVEIIASWGGNAGCTAEELFWSGAAMLVATDLLEEAGYSVRLVAVTLGSHPHGITANRVVVKEAGDPMRIDALASIVCHAGVFRTMGFRTIAQAPWDVTCTFGSHRSIEQTRDLLEKAGEWTDGAIIMDDAYTRERAVENIRSVVKRIQG